MNISPSDLQQFVTDQIAGGEFDSPCEEICEGLVLLRDAVVATSSNWSRCGRGIREGRFLRTAAQCRPADRKLREVHAVRSAARSAI